MNATRYECGQGVKQQCHACIVLAEQWGSRTNPHTRSLESLALLLHRQSLGQTQCPSRRTSSTPKGCAPCEWEEEPERRIRSPSPRTLCPSPSRATPIGPHQACRNFPPRIGLTFWTWESGVIFRPGWCDVSRPCHCQCCRYFRRRLQAWRTYEHRIRLDADQTHGPDAWGLERPGRNGSRTRSVIDGGRDKACRRRRTTCRDRPTSLMRGRGNVAVSRAPVKKIKGSLPYHIWWACIQTYDGYLWSNAKETHGIHCELSALIEPNAHALYRRRRRLVLPSAQRWDRI